MHYDNCATEVAGLDQGYVYIHMYGSCVSEFLITFVETSSAGTMRFKSMNNIMLRNRNQTFI